MRPHRQVRRYDTRPIYSRRPSAPQRPGGGYHLPEIKVSWIKLAAAGVAVLLVLALLSRATKFERISFQGNNGVDARQLEKVASEGLRKQWFGRNTALINTSALGSYIEENEPGVKQAKVKRRLPNRLEVIIEERQPSLNWRSGNSTFLLDVDGTVIGRPTGVYAKLPTVIDTNNLPVKAGERVVTAAFVKFCSEFLAQLPAQAGLQPVESRIAETTSEIYVKTDKGYTLKLDTTRPPAGEMADLKAVLGELSRSRKQPAEYIDLRIPNKAYYK